MCVWLVGLEMNTNVTLTWKKKPEVKLDISRILYDLKSGHRNASFDLRVLKISSWNLWKIQVITHAIYSNSSYPLQTTMV